MKPTNLNITSYAERYNITPNYIAVRQSGNYVFMQKCFSKPQPYLVNIGIWHIRYKKDEIIKESYGEYWDNVKDNICKDGWFSNDSEDGFYFTCSCDIEFEYKDDLYLRPISLKCKI